MSQITLSIRDAVTDIHGDPHACMVSPVIGALSADPETIDELRHAMRRFVPPEDRDDPLAYMSRGLEEEPYDAGICIVDLAGRLIAYESTYSYISQTGRVHYPGASLRDPGIPYHLSNDWMICDFPYGWRGLAKERRQERKLNPPFDSRDVLYNDVIEFIVGQCELACGGSLGRADEWHPPANWDWQQLPNRVSQGESPNVADAIAEIHARWLMTVRADLRRRMPREILLANRAAIDRDMADREYQWVTYGECPPELWSESIAFRCGGYGSHELTVYYELVRQLLWKSWNLVVDPRAEPQSASVEQSIELLIATRDEWLNTPNFQDYRGQTPASVIQRERLRLPLMMSGNDAMIDPDCPLCRILAESSAPCFWHLDPSHIDDDFPFSVHHHLEQWQEEQRAQAELRAQWKKERDQHVVNTNEHICSPLPAAEAGSLPAEHGIFRTKIFKSSQIELVSFRTRVEDLIEDLNRSPGGQDWIARLNHDMETLHEAVSHPASVRIGPIALRCNEHLSAIGESHSHLADECASLRRQLSLFLLKIDGGTP